MIAAVRPWLDIAFLQVRKKEKVSRDDAKSEARPRMEQRERVDTGGAE